MVDAESLAQPHVVFCVARQRKSVVACGAAVLYGDYAEIKRMFVDERGASAWGWAAESSTTLRQRPCRAAYARCRLETGVSSQPARRCMKSAVTISSRLLATTGTIRSACFTRRRL